MHVVRAFPRVQRGLPQILRGEPPGEGIFPWTQSRKPDSLFLFLNRKSPKCLTTLWRPSALWVSVPGGTVAPRLAPPRLPGAPGTRQATAGRRGGQSICFPSSHWPSGKPGGTRLTGSLNGWRASGGGTKRADGALRSNGLGRVSGTASLRPTDLPEWVVMETNDRTAPMNRPMGRAVAPPRRPSARRVLLKAGARPERKAEPGRPAEGWGGSVT